MTSDTGHRSGNCFNAAVISLFNDDGSERMRRPQHGAALALASHFSTRSEPAIAALPTGVGKTLVMQVLPFLVRAERALVIVPNKLLREQLVDEFANQKLARSIGLVAKNAALPQTFSVEHRITNENGWKALERYDVIVGTPMCVSPEIEGVAAPPTGFFDLLMIDEAHHSVAPSWASAMKSLADARIAMFTATPFRRDRRALPASLVYDYPMSQAIQEGLLAPLALSKIPHNGEDPDDALIKRIRTLQSTGPYVGVPFIARTATVAHARELVKRYEFFGLHVGLVLGDHSLRHVRSVVKAFKEGKLGGLVIVGTLGEGFDYPDVKIAAYHRRHKSLPATLQFFGRVTRVNAAHRVEPLVLVPDHEVVDATAALYRENADWASLIPALADEAIASERYERAFRLQYSDSVRGAVADETLMPRKVVDVFEVSRDEQISLTIEALPEGERKSIVQQFGGDPAHFISFIRMEDEKPQWLTSEVLMERRFEFETTVYLKHAGLLLISSSSAARSATLAQMFGMKDVRRLDPSRLFGVLREHNVDAYYNVGIRSVDVPSDLRPAYKTSAGPSVANSLSQIEKDNYSLGHALGKFRDGDALCALGVSVKKSRFWMPESAEGLARFVQWCENLGELIAHVLPEKSAPHLDLRSTEPMRAFPANPVLGLLGQRMLEEGFFFRGPAPEDYACADLEPVITVSADAHTCDIQLCSGDVTIANIRYDTGGHASVQTGMSLRSRRSLDPLDADMEFTHDPLTIYYADGSSTYGALYSPPSESAPLFSSLQSLEWDGVTIARERSDERAGIRGIFDYMQELLADRHPNAFLINDDGRGEIADIITISRMRDERVVVRLYHCKGARGGGANLQDLYEVLGQAQRSTRWADPQAFWPEALRRLGTRFRVIQDQQGKLQERLAAWAQAPPLTTFEIYAVQPGIAADELAPGDNVSRFLSLCQGLIAAHNVNFGLICSATQRPAGATPQE